MFGEQLKEGHESSLSKALTRDVYMYLSIIRVLSTRYVYVRSTYISRT